MEEPLIDQEMLDAFTSELKTLKIELTPIMKSLVDNPGQPPLFEKYGQVIDRIYGTAATLGYPELAEYARTIKTVCYKCSQSTNVYAQTQVKDLVRVCTLSVDRMIQSVNEPKLLLQMKNAFRQEKKKAEDLMKKLFVDIRRGSV